MASSARDTGKQAADEQTDPGYSDADQPVTLDELYEAVAELRGLVMVLAEPAILRLQAKETADAKRQAASDAEHAFPSTVLAYFKLLSYNGPRGGGRHGAGPPDGHRRHGVHPQGRDGRQDRRGGVPRHDDR
jgi:hypothetical protein